MRNHGGDMSTTTRRGVIVLAAVTLLMYTAGVLLLAIRALRPEVIAEVPVLQLLTATRAWWTITALLGVGVAAWWLLSRLRRSGKRRTSLLPLLGLGTTTVVLGLASYLPCAAGQAPFWAPLSWTLALFVGAAENPFGSIAGCAATMPLALQLARLTALLALSLGIAGVMGVLLRDRLDRARTRRARSVAFVVGANEGTLAVLRRLRAESPRRTLVAALVDDDTTSTVRDSARALGCAVLELGAIQEQTVRALATGRGGRSAISSLYALGPDAAANLHTLRVFQAVHARFTTTTSRPRAVIRVDDPWQAEFQRRSSIGSSEAWVLDTMSVVENTARAVTRDLLDRGVDGLVLVGDSPLALAILTELAQCRRDLDASRFDAHGAIPRVWVVGPTAAAVVEQHALRQRRFGNRHTAFTPEVVAAEPEWSLLRTRLEPAAKPAVILADADHAERLGSSLAVRFPLWTIYAFDAAAKGLSSEAVMERLYVFGPLPDAPSEIAIDSWERAARIAHANYVHDLREWGESTDKPSARPWDSLDAFYRESNVRLITTTLASAGSVGRSWTAEPAVDGAGSDFTPEQIRAMAEREHTSWLAHHREHGWRWSAERADEKRVHHWLLPWSALPPEAVARSESTVRDALALLSTLGYHSIPATPAGDGEPGWITARRCGTVTAERLEAPFHWTNQNGDAMTGLPGDWRVVGEDGGDWSVADPEFRTSHEHVEGSLWRRTGLVSARPGRAGETIETIEGPGSVADGDWVIRGSRGELWSVPAERFATGYTPVQPAEGPVDSLP